MTAEPHHRTALLVRCSHEEAQLIRDAAKRERRNISGYILNAVLQRIAKCEAASGEHARRLKHEQRFIPTVNQVEKGHEVSHPFSARGAGAWFSRPAPE
jgi:uncharacterized protein (DUF1778 family)